LYNLVMRTISTNETYPEKNIICVDFVYPFAILVYNTNLEVVSTQSVYSDASFKTFLDELNDSYSISVSYPITTILDDGTTASITNNNELMLSLDNCIKRETLISIGNWFAENPETCIWSIDYRDKQNSDNTYAGGYFSANPDTTITFNYNGTSYLGTWIFLYVNDVIHININLEGTSEVAQYWNRNLRAEVGANFMNIFNEDDTQISLKQACESDKVYGIGDKGPGKGIVFYDKGEYSNGWRYLEAAPYYFQSIQQWGCSTAGIPSAQNANLGYGMLNTVSIANYHDGLNDFYNNPAICNPLSDGTVAAKAALINFGIFNDWHLPSQEELELMYQNLHGKASANFYPTLYWSSTETDESTAISVDFTTGETNSTPKNQEGVNIRGIRYF